MIFATVGTCHLPFDRLIRAIDELARTSYEELIVQIGYSTYRPKHAQCFDFAAREKIIELIRRADIVITHGGFGIISDCLGEKKKIIAVPRKEEFGEAVNPQHELVLYLAQKGLLVAVEDVGDLPSAISRARTLETDFASHSEIPYLVESFIRKEVESKRR